MAQGPKQFAPFFQNGRLHFPAETVNYLIEQGLSSTISAQLTQGIWLDDSANLIVVQQAVIRLLERTPTDHPLYQALSSAEAQFMLGAKGAPIR